MNKKKHIARYLICDLLASIIAWVVFYIFRKLSIEPETFGYSVPLVFGQKFYFSLFFIPIFWVLVYYLTGYYKNIYHKSRLQDIGQTFFYSLMGVVLIFFVLLLDDSVSNYKQYYKSFITLYGLHTILTVIPRIIITSRTVYKLRNRIFGFNTLLIGSGNKAYSLLECFETQPKSTGNKFIGFISVIKNNNGNALSIKLPKLGEFEDLIKVIKEFKIEEVIIAIESEEHAEIWRIINKLAEVDVIIKVIPTMFDILRGSVNMTNIYNAPLIEIKHDLLPAWQENLKRAIDVIVSVIMLILLIPMYIFLAIGVRLSSKGPIFYSHERIGRYGKPFTIFKFRSMYIDAEKHGPALSSKNDPRITPFGLFMRKSRLDELPQFYNVFIGDMSLVGPRPERQHFIDQIANKAPHYYHLQKVRPGLTSWGQVRFGYAENVDQMIERLKYDIIYIENMSLYADIKIIILTIKTILKGSGK